MFRRHHHPLRDLEFSGPAGGPRVLVENRDGAASSTEAKILRRAGYRVAVCDGPDPRNHIGCTLLDGGSCPLVEAADAVLCDVGMTDGGVELLTALLDTRDGKALLRESPMQEVERNKDLFAGLTLVPYPALPVELVDAVDAALIRTGVATPTTALEPS